MKILHINSNYLCTKLHSLLVKELQDLSIENTVYTPRRKNQLKVLSAEKNVVESVCIRDIDRFFFMIKSRRILSDLHEKVPISEFDILHAHTLFTDGYIAYSCFQKYGIPYVVAVRNTDINIFFKYRKNLSKYGIEIMRSAKKIIFLSDTYREKILHDYVPEKYRKEIERKIDVIPNGIDSYWLQDTKNKHMENSNKINIVYAGVINKNKNILTTVNACKLLLKKGYDIHYTIVGRIEDKSVYKKAIAHDFVTYVEPLNKEGLAKLYEKQDIFVMPSRTESFGLVYAEAMSQGLPIIYTRGQGFDKQFEEGAVGYSVSADDYVSIADAVLKIAENYDAFSKQSSTLCKKFDWTQIAKKYKNIYESINVKE